MRTTRLVGLGLALLLLGCLWAPAVFADEAAQIYDPGQVLLIDLTLSPTEKAKLEAEPGEYVKGTLSMEKSSDGTPSGTEVPFVPSQAAEIRLKGNVGGSFRDLSEKAAFKLKFKKTETVLGLRKMTLNNMVQDPSMVHETLAYAAFRAAGVPASRTGYAYVRLNGEDIGVYLDLENLDETGLTRIFGSFDKTTQHLYEGEDGHDVKAGEATAFEVDEGPEGDISDLENLIEVVNSEPGEGESWSEHVAAKADLAEMTKMWAVEKYIDHWDGYSGHAELNLKPNNYYLFSEPSGRFQMLPWGADQTWIPTKGFPSREVTFDGDGGVLFNKCLEDEACFRRYWEALKGIAETIAVLGPQAPAENAAAMLAPWQAEEIAHGRPEYDATEIKEGSFGVDETIEFIEGRQTEAEQWLDANEPVTEGGEEGGGGEEEPGGDEESEEGKGGGESPAGQETPKNVADLLFPKMVPGPSSVVIGGLALARGALKTHFTVSGSGKITEWVTMRSSAGRRNVCTVADRHVTPATATVRCDLSPAAQRRLADHRVRLEVNVTFVPQDGGAAATASRRFRTPAVGAGAEGRASIGRRPSAPR